MPINTRRKEYSAAKPLWVKSRDAIAGQEIIKSKGTVYLPKLSGQDTTTYESYLKRSQYTNYSGRTHQTSISQIFRKAPISTINLGEITNIDLAGTSFEYFARDVASEILATNRVGIWVDFNSESNTPYAITFPAESIINWRANLINGEDKLTLVVLEGSVDVVDEKDPYVTSKELRWKVLSINDDGFYEYNEYKQDTTVSTTSTDQKYILVDTVIPLMDDNPLRFIPFIFGTVNGVSLDIGKGPLTDLININLGHYINSADNENRLHWSGQVTLVTKGYSKDEAIPIGGAFNLETDGGAELLESNVDSGLALEMRRKEERMAVLSSNLIAGAGRYVASAETAKISSENEYATLADVSRSLSDIMSAVLNLMNLWSVEKINDPIKIEFNTDFNAGPIKADELASFTASLLAGVISKKTFFFNMKNREVYPETLTFEDEAEEIESGKDNETTVESPSLEEENK